MNTTTTKYVPAIALMLAVILGAGESLAQSRSYCDRQARSYANRNVGGDVVGGAIGGAVIGAIIGGATSRRGRGVGTGAAIGAGVGALAGSSRWNTHYRRAFNNCMGRRRTPVRSSAPEAWTQEWYDYCTAKYRSFNPDTGYFRTYSGKRKFCR